MNNNTENLIERIKISPEKQAYWDAIENVSPWWHSIPLQDHEEFSQYSRKLVVTNFIPIYLDPPEERLYVNVSQVLTRKSNGTIYKIIQLPTWEIFEYNMEQIEDENGLIEYEIEFVNEDGEVVRTEPRIAKAPSIKYVKFLSIHRKAYLADIFDKFMYQYIEKFSSQINNI